MNGDHDVLELARKLRYDLTSCQGKLTDLMNMLAALDVPDASQLKCVRCGLRFPGVNKLNEHLYASHDGPVPPHWLAVEEASLEPEEAA